VGRRGMGGKQKNKFLPVLLELCADFVGMNNLDLFGRQGCGGRGREKKKKKREKEKLSACLSCWVKKKQAFLK
jgi:hypothetical protein